MNKSIEFQYVSDQCAFISTNNYVFKIYTNCKEHSKKGTSHHHLKKTVLLRYSSYTIKFAHLNCIIQRLLIFSQDSILVFTVYIILYSH